MRLHPAIWRGFLLAIHPMPRLAGTVQCGGIKGDLSHGLD